MLIGYHTDADTLPKHPENIAFIEPVSITYEATDPDTVSASAIVTDFGRSIKAVVLAVAYIEESPFYTPGYAQPWEFEYEYSYGVMTHDQGTVSWGGDVFVVGDVTVPGGAGLAVDAGTTVHVWATDLSASGNDTSRVEINVGGTLDVNGTVGSDVHICGWDNDGQSDDPDAWVGVHAMAGSQGLDLTNCTIENAQHALRIYEESYLDRVVVDNCVYGLAIDAAGTVADSCTVSDTEIGISVYDDVTISNTSILNPSNIGVSVREDKATLQNVSVTGNPVYGIYVERYSIVAAIADISSCTISGATGAGIKVMEAESLSVYQSTVRDNWCGIDIGDSVGAVIDSCVVSSNDQHGIKVYNASDVEIAKCAVDSNGTDGISADFRADVYIHDNSLRGNTLGIYSNFSLPTIEGNDISDNGGGIKCEDHAHATISNNRIVDNNNGVLALDDSDPNLGGACTAPCSTSANTGDNSISGSNAYHVSNLSSGVTISAECNWWGPVGPKPSKFYGPVDYSPAAEGNPNPVSPGHEDNGLPRAFALQPNIPNPFNPTTTIKYDVPDPGALVRIAIYNVRGQLVRSSGSCSTEARSRAFIRSPGRGKHRRGSRSRRGFTSFA